MERKTLLFFGLLPIGLFVLFMVIGSVMDIYAMRIAAVAILFGGEFLVAVGSVVYMFVGTKTGKSYSTDENSDKSNGSDEVSDEEEFDSSNDGDDDEEEPDEENGAPENGKTVERQYGVGAQEEAETLARINSTYGAENRAAMAAHQISHVKNAYRSSGKKEKIFGFVFLGVLLALFAGFPLFIMLGYHVAAFVCLGGFAGIIIIAGITVAVRQKISMSGKGYNSSIKRKGKVLSCTMSSSVGYSSSRRTSRVTSITYKVRLDVDGVEKTAYSRIFYEVGEELDVLCHNKWPSLAMIVSNSADIEAKQASEPDSDENVPEE